MNHKDAKDAEKTKDMESIEKQIQLANMLMTLGFPFGVLLLLTYFKYDRSPALRDFGDIFIKISFGKRDKRDLLVFATIPFIIAIFALIFRIMML